MLCRKWLLLIGAAGAFLLVSELLLRSQDDPTSADQVITRYLQAINADRMSSITTFVQRGDLSGNVTNYWQGYRSPGQSVSRQGGTYEFYFKSPNLRFSSTVTTQNVLIGMHGCDGKRSWYIDTYLKHQEFTPKPGKEYDCEEGFEPTPLAAHRAKLKMRVSKKKEIEGRMAWEIKVEDPQSGSSNFYFDAETFLLLRREKMGAKTTYSDYREVNGMKFPFTVVNEFANSKLISTVRELRINVPVSDAQFVEPQAKNGTVVAGSGPLQKNENPVAVESAAKGAAPPEASAATLEQKAAGGKNEDQSSTATVAAPPKGDGSVTEVNFPNFTACSLNELQIAVPELGKLKPDKNQDKLTELLDKVGAKTAEIARNTPNLIARESVTQSAKSAGSVTHDYDYLILPRVQGMDVGLNEFRVDLKTGDKFQTFDDKEDWLKLERASADLASMMSGRPPLSQGFATSWVHFYPLNRPQATFRYLGEQKMEGRRTLVLAFAQKPQAVPSPALFRYHGKSYAIYLQGVAWIDPSDFRILRLETDLLAPLPEVSLHRLTADIHFVAARIEEMPTQLWLPREVEVLSVVGTSTVIEVHKYSDYRLFRARSKILVNP